MTDPDPMTPMTDAFLDRIVDGELSPGELREAIERLESEPDGWKRCALAFLEAQCWRESFRAEDVRRSARRGGSRILCHGGASSPRPSFRGLAAGRDGGGDRGHLLRPGLARSSRSNVRPADRGLRRPSRPSNHPRQTEAAETGDLADVPDGTTGDERAAPDPAPPVVTVGRLRVGPSASAPAVPDPGRPGDRRGVGEEPAAADHRAPAGDPRAARFPGRPPPPPRHGQAGRRAARDRADRPGQGPVYRHRAAVMTPRGLTPCRPCPGCLFSSPDRKEHRRETSSRTIVRARLRLDAGDQPPGVSASSFHSRETPARIGTSRAKANRKGKARARGKARAKGKARARVNRGTHRRDSATGRSEPAWQ